MKSVLTEQRSVAKMKTKFRTISPDEFLTTRELMNLLKIKHKQTIYSLIEEGLPAIIVGKNYRFDRKEVINFLKKHSQSKRSKSRKEVSFNNRVIK